MRASDINRSVLMCFIALFGTGASETNFFFVLLMRTVLKSAETEADSAGKEIM